MKNNPFFAVAAALLSIIVCSCSDHESWADNYITNMAELDTDSKGNATLMRLDNGMTYQLDGSRKFNRPDTTYRCVCVYTTQGAKAVLASCAEALSSRPYPPAADLEIKQDPCELTSIWVSGGYLNARIVIQGKDKPHTFGFIDQGITSNPDGSRTLTLLLHHDQNSDMEAFSRTVYLSCLIRDCELQPKRDSVRLIMPDKTYALIR